MQQVYVEPGLAHECEFELGNPDHAWRRML